MDESEIIPSVNIGQVISELNYNASFGFNKNELPNPAPQNNNDACSKYSSNIKKHINQVIDIWFNDTGIENISGYRPNARYNHTSPMPLRTIAEKEFGVNKKLLYDIDDIIRLHDRSRFSEDEFFASANHFYGTDDSKAFQIAQLKHIQRNAHELGHYIYHDETGNIVTSEMNEAFIWERIAVWIANYRFHDYVYNDNPNHYEIFQFYWNARGLTSEYYWDWDYSYYWPVCTRYGTTPTFPNHILMGPQTQARFKEILYHWEHTDTYYCTP